MSDPSSFRTESSDIVFFIPLKSNNNLNFNFNYLILTTKLGTRGNAGQFLDSVCAVRESDHHHCLLSRLPPLFHTTDGKNC